MLYEKKNAIAVFYYLIAVDGNVTESEMETFDCVGKELDPDFFEQYQSEIAERYRNQMQTLIDVDDFYDVIAEGVDKELSNVLDDDSESEGVCSRLLLWNLLVVAFGDDSYSAEERRLIKHIVRSQDIGKDIFLEMEQLMKANIAVTRELETMERSEKPYNEIRPIIDELESRRDVIIKSATALIEDELYVPVNKVEIPKNKAIEDTKAAVGKVADTVSPIASNIGNQTKKILGNIRSKKSNV